MPKTPPFPPTPRRIEILAFTDAQLLDVAGPLQVFASANDAARAEGVEEPYQVVVIADDAPVVTSAGLPLGTQPLPAADEPVDTLMVAGGCGVDRVCALPAMVLWLRQRAKRVRRLASVCSGALLLAKAGLLDGRRATTHWSRCEQFTTLFPKVRLEPDRIFVQDGNVWTSAGVTAGIDLALALVEADLGHAPALAVARELVVYLKRPGGQAQFSAALALQTDSDRFAPLHAWISDHLRSDLSVAALAEIVGMSERSFMRRYGQATGTTPARAVERLRLEAARQMLEQGQPIKRVAARCGFGTEETLRRSFLRNVRVTPQAYRERFSARPKLLLGTPTRLI